MSIVKGYVQTDLGQIHYRKKEGEGLPIVCFHQTVYSSAMFEAFMVEFAGSTPLLLWIRPASGVPTIHLMNQRWINTRISG